MTDREKALKKALRALAAAIEAVQDAAEDFEPTEIAGSAHDVRAIAFAECENFTHGSNAIFDALKLRESPLKCSPCAKSTRACANEIKLLQEQEKLRAKNQLEALVSSFRSGQMQGDSESKCRMLVQGAERVALEIFAIECYRYAKAAGFLNAALAAAKGLEP